MHHTGIFSKSWLVPLVNSPVLPDVSRPSLTARTPWSPRAASRLLHTPQASASRSPWLVSASKVEPACEVSEDEPTSALTCGGAGGVPLYEPYAGPRVPTPFLLEALGPHPRSTLQLCALSVDSFLAFGFSQILILSLIFENQLHSAKWCSHFRKTVWQHIIKWHLQLQYDLAVPLLGMSPR